MAQKACEEGQAVLDALNAQYTDIISWEDMYDSANLEAKKMIVNCLIKRVKVCRDYKLHIDFNIDLEQLSWASPRLPHKARTSFPKKRGSCVTLW